MPLNETHKIDRIVLALSVLFFSTLAAGCYFIATPVESKPDAYASNLTCEYPSPNVTVCYDRKPKQHIYSEERAR